jgi:hypothetical protein
MKKAFLAGAGIAATLLGAPAFAATGYVDVSYTGADVGTGSGSDVSGWGVNGAAAFDLGGNGLQIDAGATNYDPDVGGSYTAEYAAGHLFHRFDNKTLGVVAGVANLDTSPSATPWDVGLEFQARTENTTFNGSVTYFDPDLGDSNGVAIQGSLKAFVGDNWSLGGHAGWVNLNSSGGDTDGYLLGLNTELQIGSSPISVFAAYNEFHANDVPVESQAASIGVRFNFGVPSIKAREASGPSLDSQGALLGLTF